MNKFLNFPVLISLIIGVFIGITFFQKTAPIPHDMMDMSGDMDMDSVMMDMSERLKGKKGDELDKIFLEDMIIHHKGAVDMAEILLTGTEREEMRVFANEIINVQSKEIDMMETWLKDWFVDSSL